MKRVLALLVPLLLAAACGNPASLEPASSSPSAAPFGTAPSPEPVPSPEPMSSPSPLPAGSPVAQRVLAPATVIPVVGLCSAALEHTADGNVRPLLCRAGEVNVQAWSVYAQLLPHLLGAGRQATLADVWAAICENGKKQNSTDVELEYGFEIAAAYYGWTYTFDPTTIRC